MQKIAYFQTQQFLMIWVHQRCQKFPGGSALSLLRPSVEFTYFHSIYIIRTFSSQSTLLLQFKLVYRPFGQSNMHSTLDFCPRPARKQTNVPLRKQEKLRAYCLNLLWSKLGNFFLSHNVSYFFLLCLLCILTALIKKFWK